MKTYLLLVIILMSGQLLASTERCYRLRDCIDKASKLIGKKHFYDFSLIKKNKKIVNLEMNTQNANEVLSSVLYGNDLTRLPVGGDYKIIDLHNIRNVPVPFYEGALENLPQTFDYFIVSIKLKYIRAREVNKSLRSFLSRQGRILPVRSTNSLMVLESGVGIHRILKMVKTLDTRSAVRKRSKRSKRHHKKMGKSIKKN